MGIASYPQLLTDITRLIDGEDVSITQVAPATLAQVINLAERRVYRDVRCRWNEKPFSGVTVTGNLAAIPADFESLSTVHLGKKALEPVTEEWLREYLNNGASGDARYVAPAGGSLMFGPAVADGTAVQGRYFYRWPDLTQANFSANLLIANEPDVFLFACLVEAVPFFSTGAGQAQAWGEKYESVKERINTQHERMTANAGRIKRRASTSLMG